MMKKRSVVVSMTGAEAVTPVEKPHSTVFLKKIRVSKVGSKTFIGKLHKRNMESFSLCNGDKTHEAWKPLLNTIHVFRGLSECFAQ